MIKSLIVFFVVIGFGFCLPSCKKAGGFWYYRTTIYYHQNYEITLQSDGETKSYTWLNKDQMEWTIQDKKPEVYLKFHRKATYGQYSVSFYVDIYTRSPKGEDKNYHLTTTNGNITWQQ
jgi:hypothetical protein